MNPTPLGFADEDEIDRYNKNVHYFKRGTKDGSLQYRMCDKVAFKTLPYCLNMRKKLQDYINNFANYKCQDLTISHFRIERSPFEDPCRITRTLDGKQNIEFELSMENYLKEVQNAADISVSIKRFMCADDDLAPCLFVDINNLY